MKICDNHSEIYSLMVGGCIKMEIKERIEVTTEDGDVIVIPVWIEYDVKPLSDILLLNKEGVLK